jgi:hypothetical protein
MVQSGPGQEPDRGGNDVTIYNLFGYDYTPANKKAAVGEFIATTLFVYVGCGVVVSYPSWRTVWRLSLEDISTPPCPLLSSC